MSPNAICSHTSTCSVCSIWGDRFCRMIHSQIHTEVSHVCISKKGTWHFGVICISLCSSSTRLAHRKVCVSTTSRPAIYRPISH